MGFKIAYPVIGHPWRGLLGMNHRFQDEQGREREVHAVLDTNVVFEFVSPHDLLSAVDDAGGQWSDLNVLARRSRIRAATILGIYFHREKFTTYTMWAEWCALIDRTTGLRLNADIATKITTHYVQDILLADWKQVGDLSAQAGLVGSKCDDHLLEIATKGRLPLITGEKTSNRKKAKRSLRTKARAAGLHVYTPQEFIDHRMGSQETAKEIDRFLDRFERHRLEFLVRHLVDVHPQARLWRERKRIAETVIHVLARMYEFYEAILSFG